METELVELFEAVKKAADAAAADGDSELSPEEDRCIDGLKRLKKFPVNYQLLVTTQVGKRLRPLTKHPRKKIQELASILIGLWKSIIVEETTKDKKNGILDKNDSMRTAETSEAIKVERVNSSKVEKSYKSECLKLDKNNSSKAVKSEKAIKSEPFSTAKRAKGVNGVKMEDKSNVVEKKVAKEINHTGDVKKVTSNTVATSKMSTVLLCKDPLRDKIRELISEALLKVSGEIGEYHREEVNVVDPYRVAVSLECALHETWGKSNGPHKVKYRSLMFNMKDPQNPDFRRKILLGHFKPEQVSKLTREEMASDERQRQNHEIKQKALFECERGARRQASTNQFKCNRCGKNECTYYQMQTRSADEPMTTYVTCVNCDNRWKFC